MSNVSVILNKGHYNNFTHGDWFACHGQQLCLWRLCEVFEFKRCGHYAVELHSGKCRIQCFWGLTHSRDFAR